MNSNPGSASTPSAGGWKAFWSVLLCLVVILGALFYKSFLPHTVAFSNDGPLGAQNSDSIHMPDGFKGCWYFLWIGSSGGRANVGPSELMRWFFGPEGFARFYEPVSLVFLGVCAWAFFRTLGLKPWWCVVGAIAAALNANYFSNACWGLGTRATTLGLVFLALSLLSTRRLGNRWLNAVLAGLAVGLGVVEGADNGAILAIYLAAFVVFQSWVEGRSLGCRLVRSSRLALVGLFALFIAWQALGGLFVFAKQGAAESRASVESREDKWNFATQWSLPPMETLRVIIPGLYGYRMDAPDGDAGKAYWGRVGEQPGHPEMLRRFNGSGEYAGMLVVLLAVWALAASFSRTLGVYSAGEKKMIWFWSGAVLVSVLFSWGRFAPFYQFVFALPYFSSIRNPMKFMHPAHMGLMVLFGYGLLGLGRRYVERPGGTLSWTEQMKVWWRKAVPFERRWVWAGALLVAVSALSYLIYGGSREDLVQYILNAGYPNPEMAMQIARHSIGEVGLYVVFLALSLGAILLVMGGVFAGKHSTWAAALLGLVLTVDLWRANTPWIVHWDIRIKYASNPVIDILKEKPCESRMVFPPFLINGQALAAAGGYTRLFPSLYSIEWVQHQFRYFNIHSLDVEQDPRPSPDKQAYLKAMANPFRYWELTSTRYLLGMAGFIDALNQQAGADRARFNIVTRFDVVARPETRVKELTDLTAVMKSDGPLALFEYANALPRAGIYTRWEVVTNDAQTLKTLADPAFDPATTVLVAEEIPSAPALKDGTPARVQKAEITSYSARRVEVQTDAAAPSVLLLNDRHDPSWHVTVDGQPASLLRANYIMRGVQLPAGKHTVVFNFAIPLAGLKISLVAVGLAVVLSLLLFKVRQPEESAGDCAK